MKELTFFKYMFFIINKKMSESESEEKFDSKAKIKII